MAHELFRATSLNVVDMSIDEHDEIIAILLGLAHAVNIAFVEALSLSKFKSSRLEDFSSPTFANLLAISKKVVEENPHLYYEIQALNPHIKQAHQLLKKSILDIIMSIEKLDEDAFVAIMNNARRYLG